MRIGMAFGRDGLEIELPDHHDYEVLESPTLEAVPDATAAVEAALNDPVAGPPLSVLAKGKQSAAISVCDITRPAPNPIVLPPLLRRLEEAGVPREGIRILIATGLHRPATDAEIRQIVSPEIAEKYTVLNHYARDLSAHRELGATKSGTPVFIDERFMSADLHMSLGFIEPHLMLGFSGGRKLVAPGLAGEATIKEIHSSRFMRDERAREASIDDNPLHAELLEIARMARHDFIVDVSLTRNREIASVFAGAAEDAHRAGVQWVSRATMRRLREPFDAVITTGGGYPLDLTYYQTLKGVTAAAQYVTEGGRILVFGACGQGVGSEEFTKMVQQYPTDEGFMSAIEGVPVTVDQWQLEKLALATRKARVSYCVPGVSSDLLGGLWGPGFHDPEQAVADFLNGLPEGSRIGLVPEGPYVLAVVDK